MTLEIDMEEAVPLLRHLKCYQVSMNDRKIDFPDFIAALDSEISNENERAQERVDEAYYGGDGPDVAYRAAMKDAGRGGQLG